MKPTTKPTNAERAEALDAFARRGAAVGAAVLVTERQDRAIAASMAMLSGSAGDEYRALADVSPERVAEYNAANRRAVALRNARPALWERLKRWWYS